MFTNQLMFSTCFHQVVNGWWMVKRNESCKARCLHPLSLQEWDLDEHGNCLKLKKDQRWDSFFALLSACESHPWWLWRPWNSRPHVACFLWSTKDDYVPVVDGDPMCCRLSVLLQNMDTSWSKSFAKRIPEKAAFWNDFNHMPSETEDALIFQSLERVLAVRHPRFWEISSCALVAPAL